MDREGIPTHADVLQWLSPDIQRELVMALGPELRGWYTEAEASDYDGPMVEVTRLGDAEPRFIPGR